MLLMKLPCLTSLTCHESDGNVESPLNRISVPFNATRDPTTLFSLVCPLYPRLFATSDRTIKILPCFTALKNEIPNHLALSRLWHAMNQMATWNRHWKGSRCHSMLREIWQNPILLLHRVEKWNPKLPCSLTFLCYESHGKLELPLKMGSRCHSKLREIRLFYMSCNSLFYLCLI